MDEKIKRVPEGVQELYEVIDQIIKVIEVGLNLEGIVERLNHDSRGGGQTSRFSGLGAVVVSGEKQGVRGTKRIKLYGTPIACGRKNKFIKLLSTSLSPVVSRSEYTVEISQYGYVQFYHNSERNGSIVSIQLWGEDHTMQWAK